MQNLKHVVFRVSLIACCVLPIAIDRYLSSKDQRYAAAIAQHECNQEVCLADFNADGKTGSVRIDQVAEPPAVSYPAFKAWLVVTESERELLRLPFNYADSTLRTHAAIRKDETGDRLLIFDHTTEGAPIKQVFSWNGNKMDQTSPSNADEEIFAALSSRDDAGSFQKWALYRSFRIPVLVSYVLLVIGAIVWVKVRERRRSKVHASLALR